MKEPVVWIVARNDRFYINMAILSVIDHAFVFVLDTGSTDQTQEVVKNLQKIYPNKIYLEEKIFGTPNKRFPSDYVEVAVRNYAIAKATELFQPDWLIQLDADEILNNRYWEVFPEATKSGEYSFGYATNILTTPYRIFEEESWMVNWSDKWMLFDPHVRTWSTKIPIKWVQRDSEHLLHIIPKVVGHEEDLYHGYVSLDNIHFHLHRSFGPKSIWHYLIGHKRMSGKDASRELKIDYDRMFYDQEMMVKTFPQYFENGRFIPPLKLNMEWVTRSKPVSHPIPEFVVKRWEEWGKWIEC